MELNPISLRVLGSLMEKARTTPEVYPLTLNSLVHACNQKSSREPVTDFDEDEVLSTLDHLREAGLVMRVDMAGSRTAKFRENLTQKWTLTPEEYAILAVLFLRGAQTPGQIRQRCDRLHAFSSLEQTVDWLRRMAERDEEPVCLVQPALRTAGTKEIRYSHTFSPPGDLPEAGPSFEEPPPSRLSPAGTREDFDKLQERLDNLEERLNEMETLLNDLTN